MVIGKLLDIGRKKQKLKGKRIAQKVKWEELEEKRRVQVPKPTVPTGAPPEGLRHVIPPKTQSEEICGKKCDTFDSMKDIAYGLRCHDIVNRMESDYTEYLTFLMNLGLEETSDLKLFDYFPKDKKSAIMNCIREKIRPLDKKRKKDLYTRNEDNKIIKVSPSLLFIANAKDGDTIEILPEYPIGGYGTLRGTAKMDEKILHGISVYKEYAEKLFGGSPEEGKSIGVHFTVRKISADK